MFEAIEWSAQKNGILMTSISENLNLRPGDTLLEVGCGGGWILKEIKNKVKKSAGLDFSSEMLKFACQTLNDIPLFCAEAGRLPFKKEAFDKILCYYVFINVTDDNYIQRSISEIWRVLKKGGKALIGQLPRADKSSAYDDAKKNYLKYYRSRQPIGQDSGDIFPPPLKLFYQKALADFFKAQRINFYFRDSFNPFYYEGQPDLIDWRFDIILEKKN